MRARPQAQATNIYRMMDLLGIDAAGGVVDQFGLAFVCAERVCATCDQSGACRTWLDTRTRPAGVPAFCPNFDLLFELTCNYPHVGTAAAAKPPSSH